MTTDETAYLQAQLTATEDLIAKLQSAIARVVTNAQRYSVDSGQTRTSKDEADLAQIRLTLRDQQNYREQLRNQLGLPSNIGRTIHVIPGF